MLEADVLSSAPDAAGPRGAFNTVKPEFTARSPLKVLLALRTTMPDQVSYPIWKALLAALSLRGGVDHDFDVLSYAQPCAIIPLPGAGRGLKSRVSAESVLVVIAVR